MTVVVIMFELTGALTYILPTMVCPLASILNATVVHTYARRSYCSSPKQSEIFLAQMGSRMRRFDSMDTHSSIRTIMLTIFPVRLPLSTSAHFT